jgi:predicted nuclease of predicted toxin-antitoxin system
VKGIQAMSEFRALRAFNNGWKVKFTDTIEKDDTTLIVRIVKKRNSLLGFSLYKTSEHNDMRVIIHEMDMAMLDVSYQSPPQAAKHRKKFPELGKRQINNIVDDVLNKPNSEYSSDGLESKNL